MKSAEEIVEKAKNKEKLENSNLLESYLYMNIELILKQYSSGYIDSGEAVRKKQLAIKQYEEQQKQYSFERDMFQEHIKASNDTQLVRIELRKAINDESEPVTEQKLAHCLNLALEILSKTYRGEF